MATIKGNIADNAAAQLALLKSLEGEWNVTASDFSKDIGLEGTVSGTMRGKFVYDGMFLELKTRFPDSPFPVATVLIGLDDTNGQFTQLYADDRDVYRVYAMTLTERVWTLERHAPDWHQRFKASFEKDGMQLTAAWEKSTDGKNWELDFKLLYEKVV